MTNTNNKQLLDEMDLYFQWQPKTRHDYNLVINAYCKYHQMTMQELLTEAETDEEKIGKVNKRRIKKRLLNYILHLKQQNKKDSTIKAYLNKIRKVYKYYDIDLPSLPTVSSKQRQESYAELPSHEDIKNALLNTNLLNKAIITFLASTGMRISDLCNIKVKDFKEAVQSYTSCSRLTDILHELEKKEDLIIPTWDITSIKTHVRYTTYSSDESTRLIIQYLKQRILDEEIQDNAPLFNLKKRAVAARLQRLNDELGLGYVGGRRFFHAHALRKYFTTTLYNEGVDFLCVDFLVGHTLKPIQASYYKANPDYLKKVYVEHIACFTFLNTVEVVSDGISDAELEELRELRAYKEETDKRLEQLEGLIKSILE